MTDLTTARSPLHGRILVVDDDPAMTDGIRDVLELAGHQVTTATDGVDALARLREVTPDVIVSDVMMPRMDGFTFYREVRSNPALTFVPFIFLTALGQQASVAHGTRLGADDYLVKPVDPELLQASVAARLRRSADLNAAAAGELRKVSRMVTGVIGHELRTPISWISAYSEILLDLRDDMRREELEEALDGIRSGSERLARMVEDAVLLVSLDTGQAAEDFRISAAVEHDLAHRLEVVADTHRVAARRRGVEIRVDCEADTPPVVVSDRHLAVMMRHLIDNAVKFSRPRPVAEVRLLGRRVDGGVEVVVEDDGVGFPADQIERVFEPLTQLDRPHLEQQGIGLGLALAKGIATLHNGRIWARSSKGGPTAIHVMLPSAGVSVPSAAPVTSGAEAT